MGSATSSSAATQRQADAALDHEAALALISRLDELHEREVIAIAALHENPSRRASPRRDALCPEHCPLHESECSALLAEFDERAAAIPTERRQSIAVPLWSQLLYARQAGASAFPFGRRRHTDSPEYHKFFHDSAASQAQPAVGGRMPIMTGRRADMAPPTDPLPPNLTELELLACGRLLFTHGFRPPVPPSDDPDESSVAPASRSSTRRKAERDRQDPRLGELWASGMPPLWRWLQRVRHVLEERAADECGQCTREFLRVALRIILELCGGPQV